MSWTKRMKPLTNDAACEWWAMSICHDEPREHREVNSIEVAGDVIYSFGRHYPMGRIVRNERGRVRRVVVTSSFYPSRGFGSTPTDQWSVKVYAEKYAAQVGIEVEYLPLSGHGLGLGIPCLPKSSDPEPPAGAYTSIPPVFHASDPGPEPVRGTEGCIAGTFEEYSYQESGGVYDWNTPRLTAHIVNLHDGTKTDAEGVVTHLYRLRQYTWANGIIYHGAHRYEHRWERADDWTEFREQHRGVSMTYKACPHCERFEEIHELWSRRYHGEQRGRWGGRGWKLYSKMVDTYGSVEGWREARLEDFRQVRASRKARSDWEDRNFIQFEAVSRDRDGLPNIVDGHALRKDSEAYFAKQRKREREQRRREAELERAERRRQREQEQRDRIRLRAQRALQRRQRNILQRSPYQRFIHTARSTAEEVHDILTNERQSNESPGGTT